MTPAIRFGTVDASPPLITPVGLPPLPRMAPALYAPARPAYPATPDARGGTHQGPPTRPQLRLAAPSGLGRRAARSEKERRAANAKPRSPIPANLYRPSPVTCRKESGPTRGPREPGSWSPNLDQWTGGEWYMSSKDRSDFASAVNRNTAPRANGEETAYYLLCELKRYLV